jgi:hypothetical protein
VVSVKKIWGRNLFPIQSYSKLWGKKFVPFEEYIALKTISSFYIFVSEHYYKPCLYLKPHLPHITACKGTIVTNFHFLLLSVAGHGVRLQLCFIITLEITLSTFLLNHLLLLNWFINSFMKKRHSMPADSHQLAGSSCRNIWILTK